MTCPLRGRAHSDLTHLPALGGSGARYASERERGKRGHARPLRRRPRRQGGAPIQRLDRGASPASAAPRHVPTRAHADPARSHTAGDAARGTHQRLLCAQQPCGLLKGLPAACGKRAFCSACCGDGGCRAAQALQHRLPAHAAKNPTAASQRQRRLRARANGCGRPCRPHCPQPLAWTRMAKGNNAHPMLRLWCGVLHILIGAAPALLADEAATSDDAPRSRAASLGEAACASTPCVSAPCKQGYVYAAAAAPGSRCCRRAPAGHVTPSHRHGAASRQLPLPKEAASRVGAAGDESVKELRGFGAGRRGFCTRAEEDVFENGPML